MSPISKLPLLHVLRPVPLEFAITARFGEVGPSWKNGHNGTDFRTPLGTTCVACDNGIVQIAHDNGDGLGNRIWIVCETPDQFYRACYAHLSRIDVMVGHRVKKGQAIGLTGNSGVNRNTGLRAATHLHFATRVLPSDEYCPHAFLV